MVPKVAWMYGLGMVPGFLPNPVVVPVGVGVKSGVPTVCSLSRLDGEKRPHLFFELASRFPWVRFVCMGRAHDSVRDGLLRERYGGVPNLELVGFVDEVEKARILDESWVLVNLSVGEGLPVAFLEAAARGCAILSLHDPDGFASRFGFHTCRERLEEDLASLIEGDLWRDRGLAGYMHVRDVHEVGVVVDRHIELYEALLE
jgi:glycosyltransferase involved in cell wall biosynthesis